MNIIRRSGERVIAIPARPRLETPRTPRDYSYDGATGIGDFSPLAANLLQANPKPRDANGKITSVMAPSLRRLIQIRQLREFALVDLSRIPHLRKFVKTRTMSCRLMACNLRAFGNVLLFDWR